MDPAPLLLPPAGWVAGLAQELDQRAAPLARKTPGPAPGRPPGERTGWTLDGTGPGEEAHRPVHERNAPGQPSAKRRVPRATRHAATAPEAICSGVGATLGASAVTTVVAAAKTAAMMRPRW